MPTDEEIAAAKATEDAAAKEAADKEAAEAKDLGLGDTGKAALAAERLRAKNAEKAVAEREKELETLRAEKATAAAAKAKADEDEAKAKGEFEKLAEERGTKLAEATTQAKTLTDERDALQAQVTAYEDRDRKRIKDGLKDLPEDLAEFDPGEDVPLSQRLAWYAKAEAQAAKRVTDPARGNGRLPDRLKGDPKADEAARAAHARLHRNAF